MTTCPMCAAPLRTVGNTIVGSVKFCPCGYIQQNPAKKPTPALAPRKATAEPFERKTEQGSDPGAFSVTLPYPPGVNNAYYNNPGHGRTLTPRARQWKCEASCVLMAHGASAWYTEQPVSIDIRAFRPQRRGDLDGVLKLLIDSLKGVVIRDDEQVHRITAERFEGGRKGARVELVVTIIGGGQE